MKKYLEFIREFNDESFLKTKIEQLGLKYRQDFFAPQGLGSSAALFASNVPVSFGFYYDALLRAYGNDPIKKLDDELKKVGIQPYGDDEVHDGVVRRGLSLRN